MKAIPTTAALVMMAAVSVLPAQPEKPRKQSIRDTVTHADLEASRRKQRSENPFAGLQPAEGNDPAKENQPEDLVKRSEILCFNGMATLVPRNSVLVVPERLADRVGMKTGAKLVGWSEFFAVNRGWLITQEITLAQARGQAPLPEDMQERLAKSSNVVVATLQGGPISRLQYKPQATPPAQ